jgi:2-polyprenyl-3-methyl-5-hydroxy-6-metoxy-1,4-benzoquinol methylase
MFVLETRRAAMSAQQQAQQTIDESRVEEFLERVIGDFAGTMTTVFCALGDRLGLFTALVEEAATADELAAKLGLHERYVREWANGLVTAGYLTRDTINGRYSLPSEHVPVLADEGGLAFMGGAHQMIREILGTVDIIERSFREGGGVRLDDYRDEFWMGLERLTGPAFEHQLVQEWIPAVNGLETRLRAGARVADVGTGTGVAPITLARGFPAATVRGFDIHAPNIVRATEIAREAGVADRVQFEQADGVKDIPGRYDLITMFAVVHDTSDPLTLLKNARGALEDNGVLLIDEINCHETVEDDQGPLGTFVYGLSLLHCTSQSMAHGCAALGTCGLPEARLRAFCLDAGFGSVERVWEGPLDAVYAVRP